jgi:16S rRNA (guanine527-N7)-methyltransferase
MSAVAEFVVAGQSVSRETFAALENFEALVRRWNPAINLVSKASLVGLRDRHTIDSAQLLAFCPSSAQRWVDLGSGGGFPGLVIAILARELRTALHVTLVESDARKATFLREAVRVLNLDADIRNERIESLLRLEADVLSARALAPLAGLLSYAEQHLQTEGVALFPKGAKHNEELVEARKLWRFDLVSHASLLDSEAAVLEIRKVQRAQQS